MIAPHLDLSAVESRLMSPRGPVGVLAWPDAVDSTNLELERRVLADPESWPDFSVLGAEHQSAGAGRRGRTFSAPPSSALTVSVLLRPGAVPEAERSVLFGWLPLLAGLAVVRALGSACGLHARLKWPNDVLVGPEEKKITGVLGRIAMHGEEPLVIIGAGTNVRQTAEELPVPHATSVVLQGGRPSREDLLGDYLEELAGLRSILLEQGAGAVRTQVEDALATLGRRVRAELPGDRRTTGLATGLGPCGELMIDGTHALSSADVHHLRAERS